MSPKKRTIGVILLIQLLIGMHFAAQRYFFPIYIKDELGHSAALASAFVSLSQLVGMLGALLGGALPNTLGRKKTLRLGLSALFLSNFTFLVAVPWQLAILWPLGSLALSFQSLISQSYLIELVGKKGRLGILSALYNWGFTLGGALGNPVAGVVLDRHGFPLFAVILLGLTLLPLTLVILGLPNQPPLHQQSRSGHRARLANYLTIVRRPQVIRLGLLRFLPTLYWGMATLLLPLLINDLTGRKTAVAFYVTASLILASLSQLIAGYFADRVGSRLPTLTAFSILTASIFGLALYAEELWGLYLFGILGAAAAWALSTLMPSLVARISRPQEEGRILGLLVFLWNIAMMAGSLTGGALVSVHPGLPFLLAGLASLGALLIAHSFFAHPAQTA
ncbi:MAG: MFS transporter [Chloroflexota bacterium]|nr:MFS transporter [Chloroflexota bacterium]